MTLSPLRAGRITASRIGAVLGLSPFKTTDDVVREMVREHHGAPQEFSGNIATRYGQEREPIAMLELMEYLDVNVRPAEFVIHPEHDFLGCTPDGLVGDDTLVEIKCPYSLRDAAEPDFKTLDEQPHYAAQVQLQLACTGRDRAIFYQWTKASARADTVRRDTNWLPGVLPALRAFMARVESELGNPAHLSPLRREIDGPVLAALLDEYDAARAQAEDAAACAKEALARIVAMAKDRDAIVCGRKLTRVERAGSVSYARVVKDHLPGLDLDPYRGEASHYWRLE